MIVRDVEQCRGTRRHSVSPTSESIRLLLAQDAMGFSLNLTTLEAGVALRICYEHHLEAVYCVAGRGTVEEERTGTRHPIRAGVLYALDRHDAHVLRVEERLELVCVFNPALVGHEVRAPDGGYPPPEPG